MSEFVQIVHDGVGQYGRGEVVRKELLGDVDRLLGLGAVREVNIPVQAGPAQEFVGENQQAADPEPQATPTTGRRRRAAEDPNANVPSPSENANAAAAAEQAIAQAVAAAQDAAQANTGQADTGQADDTPPLPTPDAPVPVEEAIEAAPLWQEQLDQEASSGTQEQANG